MKIRLSLILFFISFFCFLAEGQFTDFGIWYSINPKVKLSKKLDAEFSIMLRTLDNASRKDQLFAEAGLNYKLSDAFELAGSYRLVQNLEADLNYHIRHKLFTDFKGTFELNDFNFSARLRFQMQYLTFLKNIDKLNPNYTGRIRFKCLYKTPKFPVNPYLSIELFRSVFEGSEKLIEESRLTAGFEYKISKIHSIELEYIRENENSKKQPDMNIIGINYNLKF